MITFEQFLQRFCKRAGIKTALSKEELRTYIRKNFFTLCEQEIINGTYLKRYKSRFKKIGVVYNESNHTAQGVEDNKNLCIFIEGNIMRKIGENSLVYCKNAFISIKDTVEALCKNSIVYCNDYSKVNAIWCESVVMFDNAQAVITGCSDVTAEGNAKVTLNSNCITFALDNATIEAKHTCYIQAQDNVNITASDYTCIVAKDNVKIEADETCIIKRV